MADGFLVLLFIFSAFSTNIHACSQIERSSLQSFALALSTSTPLNWTAGDCCRWEGITCNPGGSVTHLSLPSKGLKLKGGYFPSSSLENLTHLTHFNLSNNSLYGSLDTSTSGFFLSLTHLEVLDLSYNLLSGELPLSLPFRYIRVLDLSNNRIKGTVPSSFLQHAWNLSSVNVSNNYLTGQIPSSICLHSSLVRLLDFSSNGFNGIIPPGLQNCSKLEVLRAGFNDLSGPLPSDIYNIPTLQEISLPSNKLFGPVSCIVNLTNLRILELYFNKLTGSLPLDVGKLSKLGLLILHLNDLQGSLPLSLMNCTSLIELNLGFNQLGGDISKLNFSRLTRLSKLDLVGNHFTGTLPISLYSCKSLKALRLSGNNLEGQIKPEILSLKSLSFLSLARNRLTNVTGAMQILMGSKSLTVLILSVNFVGEEMPDGDGMIDSAFQNLRLFSLSGCRLTGQIPLWLSKLKKLEILVLSSNRITGTIPGWLGTLPNLFYVDLKNNSLSGEFPKELCRLQALVSPRKAATQTGHGYLELPTYSEFERTNASITPLEYKNLSNMPRVIDIMNNSLSGRIPTEIGQLRLLQKLDLSLNNLLGGIPNQISNLTNLERLDLSRNQLSGGIPASLSSLHFLSSFAVAYNNLQGQIPSSTQLQGFSATAFEGNPGLCGAPLPINCEQMNRSGINNRTEDVHNGSEFPWWHISVALGFITGFWGVCGPLVLSRSWRCAYFQFLYGIKDKVKNMVAYGRM